ncbi:MAG: hypothetical protein JKY65_23335 [Planctomycetes bacterium]|nr:hypothetical protein [Planctomycetota bacterium]
MVSLSEQLNLARAASRAGSLREAEALLGELIATQPDYAPAFNDRGCVRLELGLLDGALRDLAEALRLRSDFPAARRNFEIVSNLVEQSQATSGQGAASTVSTALAGAARAGSFADALLDYLRAQVRVPAGQEDLRDDAIQEVALRVVGLSRSEDLPLAEALRRLRRSSTRAWVRTLLGVARRREATRPLPDELEAPPPLPPSPEGSLRVEALVEGLKEQVLAGSQSATRWRRRLVWDVYVGSLLEGVRLTRREVVETLRRLKVGPRRVKDSQILADLDRITAVLRAGAPG